MKRKTLKKRCNHTVEWLQERAGKISLLVMLAVIVFDVLELILLVMPLPKNLGGKIGFSYCLVVILPLGTALGTTLFQWSKAKKEQN